MVVNQHTPGGLPFAVLVLQRVGFLALMPHNLKRITGRGDLHFITFTCYQRRTFLASPRSKNLAVQVLGQVRAKFKFSLVGYVLMPDHVHLLISEPARATPADVIQVFKQRVSRKLRARRRASHLQLGLRFPENGSFPRRFWQRRYYDFNVYSRRKLREKLDYMHANPVIEKLVTHPKDWPWSSWSAYVGKPALLPIDFAD
jgi:putative transposase